MGPDDLPIALMIALFGGVLLWWWRTARRNDRLLESGGEAAVKAAMDGPPPQDSADDLAGAKLHTWPHLLRVELLGAMALLAFLGVWTILVDAPLEQLADPARTPNPSKAPWYFLGLQELLVYFDPWIAGVVLPLMIIFGLCAIPYLDPNPSGVGYYSWRGRRVALSVFLFGLVGLWLPLIVIGTFFRGPGWGWFWPWERWDAEAVADHPSRNLADLVGVSSPLAATIGGSVVLCAFFALGFGLAFSSRARATQAFRKMGPARVAIATFLALSMLGLPIKIALRLLFDVKYVLVTPWFNV